MLEVSFPYSTELQSTEWFGGGVQGGKWVRDYLQSNKWWVFFLIMWEMTAAVKQACGRAYPGSKVQAPSMLSVPLTLAVNQSSQEVTGQDVWGSRVTPRGEHSRDLHSPSIFLSQVITQEVHTETHECPACTRNNAVFYEFWPECLLCSFYCYCVILFSYTVSL